MNWDILAPVLGGTAALLTALIKFVPAVRMLWETVLARARKTEEKVDARLELQSSLRVMRRTAALKHALEQIVTRKGVQRGLLLVANNGGEAWKAGGPLFVSNTAQVVGPGEPNTQNLWQGWRVDAWYVSMLGRLLESYERKRGLLLVPEHDVDGELRKQYEQQGTVASVVLPFEWQAGGVLWYVSLNFGRADGSGTKQHVKNAQELYDSPARVRALIDSLRAAYNSVP